MRRSGWLLLGLWACTGGPEPVVPPPPDAPEAPLPAPEDVGVRYELDLTQAHTQRIHVAATARHDGSDAMTWWMPVWTPGSYLVREYARHIETIEAVGAEGEALDVLKTTKNRFEIAAGGQTAVTLRYTLYANEPSVRTNWVHADGAVVVGAGTFLVPTGREAEPSEVVLSLPPSWTGSATSMAARGAEAGPHRYVARDLDELVDAPIVAGPLSTVSFEVAGVPHEVVRLGGDETWDDERTREDVRKVTEVVADFWGAIPYDRYTYLNVVTDGRGGLEHMDSTLMMAQPSTPASEGAWKGWLGLVSHEFFHTWNVKRLRPSALTTYAYEHEQYTPSLWIAEGLTSYYDDLLLVRAGLLTPDEHLSRIGDALPEALSRPAAKVQSLAEASHDAWIKYYRGDDNRINRDVSYYRKGAVVGWLLDARIREATYDRVSLDDVLRTAWARHADGGYTEAQFRAVAAELAGTDLSGFFAAYVDGTATVDLGPALDWWGLRVVEDPQAGTPWLGLSAGGAPLTVRSVRRDAPAFEAGVNVGDELIAIGDRRLDGGVLDEIVEGLEVGDTVQLMISRRGRLRTLTVPVGPRPAMDFTLQVDPQAGRAAALRREAWWRGD